MTIRKDISTILRCFFRLFPCFAFLLTGCEKDEVEPQNINFEITVAYPINGLGDRSYCDRINQVVSLKAQLSHDEDLGISMSYHFITPTSIEEVKDKLQDWDDTPQLESNTYHLLILADETYEDLMRNANNWRKDSHRDMLVLNRHNENDSRTFYRDLPLYGPAWESGYMAKVEGDRPALLLANGESPIMIDARQGWLDGYATAGGNPDEVPVYDDMGFEESRAITVSDSLFQAGYDNVVCVIGGGQTGALRSLVFKRRLFGGIYEHKRLTLCENDFGGDYDSYIRHEIFKCTSDVVLFFLDDWIYWRTGRNISPPEHIVVYDLMDYRHEEYVLGLLGPSGYYTSMNLCDSKIREIAADAEKKYYSQK